MNCQFLVIAMRQEEAVCWRLEGVSIVFMVVIVFEVERVFEVVD